MRSFIPALASKIVPDATTLKGVGARLQANPEPKSGSNAKPDDFLAAIDHAGIADSSKINSSAILPPTTAQAASGSATTAPGTLYHVAARAAVGTVEKGAMPHKDGEQGEAGSAILAWVQAPVVLAAAPPASDSATPCVEKPAAAAQPATAATSPDAPPEAGTATRQLVHVKPAARRDADKHPAVAGQAVGLHPDLAAVTDHAGTVTILPTPPLLQAAAAAVAAPLADPSPMPQVSLRPSPEVRGSAPVPAAAEAVAPDAVAAAADVAPQAAGEPSTRTTPSRSAGVMSHEPRQDKVDSVTTPAATPGPTASGAALPTVHHAADGAATQHLLSMMASAPEKVACSTSVPMLAGTPQPDPSTLPAAAAAAKPLDTPQTGSVQRAMVQVAPALISLATRNDGSHELTVSLNPRDLGQVEVHLVRNSDGTTAVTITASRPDVLHELSQNVHHLHAALDAADIPTDRRVMNFVTAAAASDQPRTDLSAHDSPSRQDGGVSLDTGGRSSTGDLGQGAGQSPGQGRTGQRDQPHHASRDAADDNSPYRSRASVASRTNWQLSGLNITA